MSHLRIGAGGFTYQLQPLVNALCETLEQRILGFVVDRRLRQVTQVMMKHTPLPHRCKEQRRSSRAGHYSKILEWEGENWALFTGELIGGQIFIMSPEFPINKLWQG